MNAMIPAQIENWSIILDLNNVGITQVPKSLLKGIISAMQKNYRGRLYRMYMVNSHWLIRGLWKVAKQWMDEFTVTKINILGHDFSKELLNVIDEDKLEVKYGGKLANKESNFFPPDLI
jgi:hypothetical protein